MSYLCISTLHRAYYGSCGMTKDTHERVLQADAIDLLYEMMGQRKADVEEDFGSGERSWVTFGDIIEIATSTVPDTNRIIASKAWQNRLAEEQAERDADAAEELRISEEAERLREEAEREERTIYILSYSDGMYPEDNTIIATFGNEDAAKERMRLEVSSWMTSHGPRNHHTKEYNYTITEQEII